MRRTAAWLWRDRVARHPFAIAPDACTIAPNAFTIALALSPVRVILTGMYVAKPH